MTPPEQEGARPVRDHDHGPTHARLPGRGIELACDLAGSPRDPTVLLLHGAGQTRDSWTVTRDTLATAGFRVIAPDQRGHGDSDWAPTGTYSPQDYRDDVLAICHHLDQPVAAVGASLGGASALMAASEQPERFWGLVLVDIATRIELPGIERIVGFMTAHPNGFETLDEAADAVANYLPQRGHRVQRKRSFERNLRRGPDGRYRWHWDPALFSHGGLALTEAEQMQTRMRQAARQVRTPTLLVRGGRSDILSTKGVEEFRGLVPHAQYVEIAPATHMVVGDDNDAFTQAVADFLQAHRPKRP